MPERVQKIISACGVASRRSAEKMIAEGKVLVNGVPAVTGQLADLDSDVITVCGKALAMPQKHTYIMLNKPKGYVTTMNDEKGRKTVCELVSDAGRRVYPVGRLDINSEGMLIMTDDGELANHLMHPSGEKVKTYFVWVRGDAAGAIDVLNEPMEIDGYQISDACVKLLNVEKYGGKLSISIHEGRNRQIRKMCEKAGLYVTRLVRVSISGLKLGELKSGEWRYLTEDEIAKLKA